MAYIVSPALGMNLADPTTIQNFETPVVNNNFLALENGIVADRVRLTSLEALPPALATPTLYARGQSADFLVVDPAALDAVTTASIGDRAWMTTPGTGVDALTWVAVADTGAGLDWRNETDLIVVDTKAHLDTFIAAIAATTDLRFHIGSLIHVTGTKTLYRITSAVGAYALIDDKIIIPTSIAGTGAVLDALTGVVVCTTVTSVAFNVAFAADGSGLDDYELVIIKTAASAANSLLVRLRLSGTDALTNYDAVVNSSNNNINTSATTLAATSYAPNGGTGTLEQAVIRITGAALAAATLFQSFDFVTPNPATAAGSALQHKGGLHRDATAYDGFSITTSTGTFTGLAYLRRKK